jgi:hypothetical protein
VVRVSIWVIATRTMRCTMTTMASGKSITMTAVVRAVGVVGITTTSGTNRRRMECAGVWSVLVGRRRVLQWSTVCILTHWTQR